MSLRARTSMPAVLAAVAIAAGGLPTATAGASADNRVPQPEASDDITWETCPDQVTVDTAECGRIDVPMYHANPDGEQISVGFVRVPASDPGVRRGTLFAVNGGPGGDGYAHIGAEDYLMNWPQDMKHEWDMVSVQPRGQAGSTPLECNHQPTGWDPLRAHLTEAGGYFKAACEIGTPGYTDSINTSETADDLDDVRDALGEEKVSVMGVSYGTHLGSTYATKYPEHTDRLVLDSGFDTGRAWNGFLDDQTGGYTRALHDFLEWVADNNDTYGLGETPLEVYQAWSRVIVEESGTNPTVVPPPARIGDLPAGLQWAGQPAADILTATGQPQAQLENLFHMVSAPGARQSASPTLTATHQVLPQPQFWGELAEIINGTTPIPSPEEQAEAQSELDPELIAQQDAALSMQQMVICNENQVTADPMRIPGALWNNFVEKDVFSLPGDTAMAGLNCAGVEPDAPFVHINGGELDVRPLQIQGTGDPQTVYRTHDPMAKAMNSHVITVDGPGHAQVGVGNSVVDDAVVEYLRTGTTDITAAPSRPVG
ncbi:alpha/beta fold hydrolase [Corynebacterium sp. USCH3]|uniref:alpha/beta fold hydrolase n=1 Tax=Corynebacterium sp. USCH3 TaxID=3024840 RepID=UPI0030A776A3